MYKHVVFHISYGGNLYEKNLHSNEHKWTIITFSAFEETFLC